MIDGRMVEAKKAVSRDNQHIFKRNSSNAHGSPAPARTKKIFVGGLASTVTEADFKKYFDQFGTITDVVVIYDHNTQRTRGFGFITFDSEDVVDQVLLKTFHELNGKMVEVKKAVPKELSPGPSMRSPVGGYNYGLSRVSSFLNADMRARERGGGRSYDHRRSPYGGGRPRREQSRSIPNSFRTVYNNRSSNQRKKINGTCDFCHMNGHKKERCYRLIGYSPNFKYRKK